MRRVLAAEVHRDRVLMVADRRNRVLVATVRRNGVRMVTARIDGHVVRVTGARCESVMFFERMPTILPSSSMLIASEFVVSVSPLPSARSEEVKPLRIAACAGRT